MTKITLDIDKVQPLTIQLLRAALCKIDLGGDVHGLRVVLAGVLEEGEISKTTPELSAAIAERCAAVWSVLSDLQNPAAMYILLAVFDRAFQIAHNASHLDAQNSHNKAAQN